MEQILSNPSSADALMRLADKYGSRGIGQGERRAADRCVGGQEARALDSSTQYYS